MLPHRVVPLLVTVAGALGCTHDVVIVCDVTADCSNGAVCLEGTCVEDARPAEGEGDASGEGEGEEAGGEGEGDASGEGEGDAGGEGEGEGEGDPCGGACDPYQQCVAGTCQFTGELCDTFGEAGTVGPFAHPTGVDLGPAGMSVRFDGFLPAQTDAAYFYNSSRLVFDAMTSLSVLQGDPTPPLPAQLIVQMKAADFDPYLAVVQDGACTLLGENDDASAGDDRTSIVAVDLRDVDDATYVVATSFGGDVQGTYELTTRPTLCGLTTDSLATWNVCVKPMFTRDFTCASNPCARDANNNLIGKYCCLHDSCGRTGDAPITLVTDTALCN